MHILHSRAEGLLLCLNSLKRLNPRCQPQLVGGLCNAVRSVLIAAGCL